MRSADRRIQCLQSVARALKFDSQALLLTDTRAAHTLTHLPDEEHTAPRNIVHHFRIKHGLFYLVKLSVGELHKREGGAPTHLRDSYPSKKQQNEDLQLALDGTNSIIMALRSSLSTMNQDVVQTSNQARNDREVPR